MRRRHDGNAAFESGDLLWGSMQFLHAFKVEMTCQRNGPLPVLKSSISRFTPVDPGRCNS